MTIRPFYRHGIMSSKESMDYLVQRLGDTGYFRQANNECYKWNRPVVESGLKLACQALPTIQAGEQVLLVGHSQGGLVCRVAAVALAGKHLGTCGPFTNRISQWQSGKKLSAVDRRTLGVVTIATPNAGAMTFGQTSVAAELLGRTILEAAGLLHQLSNIEDLVTPRLFQELENWQVNARHLSISAVCVNRYNRGLVGSLKELLPMRRVSVRFNVPNDLVVEDSSTDLRQSLIRPEVDLVENYKHVRAYPTAISLDHSSIRESPEVAKVIAENLDWIFAAKEA